MSDWLFLVWAVFVLVCICRYVLKFDALCARVKEIHAVITEDDDATQKESTQL